MSLPALGWREDALDINIDHSDGDEDDTHDSVAGEDDVNDNENNVNANDKGEERTCTKAIQQNPDNCNPQSAHLPPSPASKYALKPLKHLKTCLTVVIATTGPNLGE